MSYTLLVQLFLKIAASKNKMIERINKLINGKNRLKETTRNRFNRDNFFGRFRFFRNVFVKFVFGKN